MTEHRETTRYATPSLKFEMENQWLVRAQPWDKYVGWVERHGPSWTAHTPDCRYAGMWPKLQAAAEVLVRQAGYEVGEL